MTRKPRSFVQGGWYHIINRSNGRFKIFETPQCYNNFCKIVGIGQRKFDVEIGAYCIMPNHWHFLAKSTAQNQLSKFIGWISNTHTRRFHVANKTVGQGPLYQGRFKAVCVDSEDQLITVCRYIERNPLTARLVTDCSEWRWSSISPIGQQLLELRLSSYQKEARWLEILQEPFTEKEHIAMTALK